VVIILEVVIIRVIVLGVVIVGEGRMEAVVAVMEVAAVMEDDDLILDIVLC
jgi:hypothetical protein